MASDYSTSLKLEKPNKGDQDNTWGATLRSNWDILDKSITAHESIDASSGVTLSDAQSRNPVLEFTGTLATNREVIVPTRDKHYWVYNNTSGNFSLTVKTSAGTGVAVTQGAWAKLYCDGTNVEKILQDALEGGGAITTDATGAVYINDTANADVTIGLTINQGANSDQILALKSSTVTHGFTDEAETDTFLFAKLASATLGGAVLEAIGEDNADTDPAFLLKALGKTADTTKSTSGRALMEFYAAEHDGANAIADVAADGNAFGWRARRGAADVALMLLDEDGDLWAGGTATFDGGIAFTGATVTDVTGADTKLVSGTAGTDGNVATWNADGDLVDGGSAPGGYSVVQYEYQQPDGTDGGSLTGGSWQTYPITDEVFDPDGLGTAPNANQFDLAAGTYELSGRGTFSVSGGARLRLRNITDSTTDLGPGLTIVSEAPTTHSEGSECELRGVFTIAATKTFEIQYFSETSQATTGLGADDDVTAGVEIFGIFIFRKIG